MYRPLQQQQQHAGNKLYEIDRVYTTIAPNPHICTALHTGHTQQKRWKKAFFCCCVFYWTIIEFLLSLSLSTFVYRSAVSRFSCAGSVLDCFRSNCVLPQQLDNKRKSTTARVYCTARPITMINDLISLLINFVLFFLIDWLCKMCDFFHVRTQIVYFLWFKGAKSQTAVVVHIALVHLGHSAEANNWIFTLARQQSTV